MEPVQGYDLAESYRQRSGIGKILQLWHHRSYAASQQKQERPGYRVGCRPTSSDANGAGNNNKNKVGITPDCFPRKENTASEAAYWDAQENRRIQTTAEKQKKLSL